MRQLTADSPKSGVRRIPNIPSCLSSPSSSLSFVFVLVAFCSSSSSSLGWENFQLRPNNMPLFSRHQLTQILPTTAFRGPCACVPRATIVPKVLEAVVELQTASGSISRRGGQRLPGFLPKTENKSRARGHPARAREREREKKNRGGRISGRILRQAKIPDVRRGRGCAAAAPRRRCLGR